tara:strand:- start:203 stop:463 length:261 start_codon:yes stop_codon:yes gene_type:complete
MDSGIIGKVDKAKRYSNETERVNITNLQADFQGEHDTYKVSYNAGDWDCECLFFSSRGLCSHTMALQRILNKVIDNQNIESDAFNL